VLKTVQQSGRGRIVPRVALATSFLKINHDTNQSELQRQKHAAKEDQAPLFLARAAPPRLGMILLTLFLVKSPNYKILAH
jgi:hypothetical protein